MSKVWRIYVIGFEPKPELTKQQRQVLIATADFCVHVPNGLAVGERFSPQDPTLPAQLVCTKHTHNGKLIEAAEHLERVKQ